ncbi:MAG: helix-turn-helix domain-containing protein [Desulfobacteraceae bacterium]|nr:helix-turn-helix domain-containing protein [Desulfobacteraceae bacterium]
MTEFGRELKRLREQKQATTKEVGKAVGIPQSRYSELEKGIRVPVGGQIERLEKYYGVSPGSLAGLMEKKAS